jgi:hypothetical protein
MAAERSTAELPEEKPRLSPQLQMTRPQRVGTVFLEVERGALLKIGFSIPIQRLGITLSHTVLAQAHADLPVGCCGTRAAGVAAPPNSP